MSVETFTKQSREQFTIWGSILDVQESEETIVQVSSTVTATDKEGKDAGEILNQSSIELGNDPDGTATDNMLGIKVRDGVEAKSPYWITFLMVTTANNRWEVDVKMKVKESPSFPAVSTTTTT